MRTSRTIAAVAGVASLALVATGCAGGSGDSGGSAGGDVKLTVATFNEFGYSDELLQKYMDENPGVTIVHNRAATSNDARDNFFTKLGAGSGLSDVEAVEVDWFAEMMQYSDRLADLSDPELEGRWVDFKTAAATDADGRLVAYGTDIGPEAVCYRSDLFAEAGLPTDRDEVAALLEGDWDTYFDAGRDYTEATGKPWFDSAGATYQGLVNQIEYAYEEEDGTIIATENPDVEAAYEATVEASADLSAGLGQWSDDWMAGLANGAFATMLCPGWMLGVISGNAPEVDGWDVANVFPGGGGNWGGSYLTVPAQGKNVEEATKLAAWLTAPEQQLTAFESAGTFPSQTDTYTDEVLTGATDEYFNDAPIGEIFIERSEAIEVSPYKSVKYFPINDAMQRALTRVDVEGQDPETSWNQWVSDVEALG